MTQQDLPPGIQPGISQGFPEIKQPLVDANGMISQTWLQLLVALWNRTGGAGGIEALLASIDTQDLPSVPPVGFEATSQGGLEARIADLEKLAAANQLGLSSAQGGLNQLIELIGEVTGRGFPTISTVVIPTVLFNGTYTPTITNIANVAASGAYVTGYFRVRNTVTVFGQIDIDPTLAATLTQLDIDLPIPSNLANAEELSGVGFCRNSVSLGLAIYGNSGGDLARFEYISTADVGSRRFNFIFSYQVL